MRVFLGFVFLLVTGRAGPLSAAKPCPQKLSPHDTVSFAGKAQAGDIIISLKQNGRLLGLNPSNQTFYLYSTATAGLGLLDGISVNPADTGKLIVSVDTTGLIKEVDATGALAGDYGSITGTPKISAFNPADGSLWVPDQGNSKLWRIPAGGGAGVEVAAGGLLSGPTGCAFDNQGNLYITNNTNHTVLKCSNATASPLSPSLNLLASLGQQLQGILYGGDGFLYTVGYPGSAPYNGTVFKINASTGAFSALTTSFAPLAENGGGVLYNPDGLAMDLDGYLWVVLRHGAGNDIGGILKIDTPTGTPLAYLAIPDTVSGLSGNLNSQPDDACVLGLALPRAECRTHGPKKGL